MSFVHPNDIVQVPYATQPEPWPVPASDPDYVKHVQCDGARYHVVSYSSQGMRCSHPRCIMNKPQA